MQRVLWAALLASSLIGSPLSASAQEVPVFPNEDRDADPAVSAEQGGKGFGKIAEKLGFKTNTTFKPVGDPAATKGGELVKAAYDYPSNFRPYGPQANTAFNYLSRELMFGTLLWLHTNTNEWVPDLASHWKKSKDGMTFWYRLNPNAKWADGSPVTTDDIYFTWKLFVDPTLGSPSQLETYTKFNEPERVSKYILKITCKKKNWRNFLYFSGFYVLPAKQIRKYVEKENKAKDWVRDFNTTFMMANGPYEMRAEDQKKGMRMSLRRRKDYWGWGSRRVVGMFNFDTISRVVISDSKTAFERLKKGAEGDINLHLVSTAKRWVKEMRSKKIKAMARGLIQKRKIYNEQPQGVSGVAINMSKAPYSDVRVRKALALLFNRKRLLKELMFNQYKPLRSYWPGGEYENPENPKNSFNPKAALKLLAAAGWSKRNSAGQLIDAAGKPLVMKLTYGSPGLTPHLTMFQESLKTAGVTLNLDLTRPQQLWSQVQEKKYELAMMSWGALLFPNPESSYKGALAGKANNNNITAFKNEEVDKLIAEYDTLELEELDRRRTIIRKIDGILAKSYPYVLFWYGPYERFLYWNTFGFPKSGLSRVEDYRDVDRLWWWDQAKAKKLAECRADKTGESKMEVGKTVVKFWAEKRKLEK